MAESSSKIQVKSYLYHLGNFWWCLITHRKKSRLLGMIFKTLVFFQTSLPWSSSNKLFCLPIIPDFLPFQVPLLSLLSWAGILICPILHDLHPQRTLPQSSTPPYLCPPWPPLLSSYLAELIASSSETTQHSAYSSTTKLSPWPCHTPTGLGSAFYT